MKSRWLVIATLVILSICGFVFVANPHLHLVRSSWLPGTPAYVAQKFFQEVYVKRKFVRAFKFMDPKTAKDFMERAQTSYIDIPQVIGAETLIARPSDPDAIVLVSYRSRSRSGHEVPSEAIAMLQHHGLSWRVVSVAPDDTDVFQEFMELVKTRRFLESLK